MNTPFMPFAVFMLGGLVGLWVHNYCSRFAERILREVHQLYCEIYPQNPPHVVAQNALLKPLKCGHFSRYFFIFAAFFTVCFYLIPEARAALSFALYITLLWIISLLDWHYRLIPVALCQQLMVLALICAYGQIIPLNVEQSLLGIACGFVSFFLIYQGAKYYYRQEAFGRGDYWLIAGLAGFIPWQHLPLMIFIACVSALIYAIRLKLRQQANRFIPFAPFLCLGGLFTFCLNNVSIIRS